MKSKGELIFTLVILVGLLSGPAIAGQINIGTGAVIDTGDGAMSAGCGSLQVDGAAAGHWLDIDSVTLGAAAAFNPHRVAFGGDWHSAALTRITGVVAWVDVCARSPARLTGSHDFDALHIESGAGLIRQFDADGQQQILESLRLVGGNDRLVLGSTVPGRHAALTLTFGATQQISRVDVRDIDSSAGQVIAPGMAASFGAINSGNMLNWFRGLEAIPVPSAGFGGLLLLVLALVWLTRRHPAFRTNDANSNPIR